MNRRAGWLGFSYRCLPLGVLVCLAALACQQEEASAPESEPVAQVATDTQEQPAAEPGLRPFLPDEMQRSTRAESFPHGAHRQIDCAVCHDTPQGHATHQDISCADCHLASADVTVRALAPADCQSCHHSPDRALACENCHESRPTVATVQQLDFEVWNAPRTRTLDFAHSRHSAFSCDRCHQALPSLLPAESCSSCHSEHHTASVSCVSCHEQPPAGAHDVQVHLTCSGSGCHRAPEVEAIATSRNVCLVCHRAQETHEPGGNCIECHRVRGDPVALATWGHS